MDLKKKKYKRGNMYKCEELKNTDEDLKKIQAGISKKCRCGFKKKVQAVKCGLIDFFQKIKRRAFF